MALSLSAPSNPRPASPDQATIDRVFGERDRVRTAGLPTGVAIAGLTVPLPGVERFELSGDLQGGLAWVPVDGSGELRPLVGLRLGTDFAFRGTQISGLGRSMK